MSQKIPIVSNVFEKQPQRKIKGTDNVFANFLVDMSLYNEIEITKDNIYELADLIRGYVKINIYCPKCGERRVFCCKPIRYICYDTDGQLVERFLEEEIVSWQHSQSSEDTWTWTNRSIEDDTRLMVFKFICAMDDAHHLDYIVLTDGNKMTKIGQYPSVADLSFPELKEYRKVMTKEDEKELKKAIGLFASGIGVGSFVYLRRIFERIIVTTSQKAIEEKRIKEEEYKRAHVDEKIKMLADYLPELLVKNAAFYGIVSKGIHELSEDDCMNYFPVMKSFIMMILRHREEKRRNEEEKRKLTAALSNIATEIKRNK